MAVGSGETCNHCGVDDNDPDEFPGSTDTSQTPDIPGSTGAGANGEVEYDCSPWAQETRQVLRSLLVDNEVPHAWEGTVLVVPAALEEAVDEMVEGARSTARSSLGTVRATVAYQVSLWSAGSQNSLIDELVEARIPHEWDSDGDLMVHEEDCEAVEVLIDALGDPDGGDELDGIALHDRLNEVFVFVDRLCRDSADKRARKGLRRAYVAVENAAVPFGVGPDTWLGLHREADALLRAINGEPDDEDPSGEGLDEGEPVGVQGHAERLRDLLRRFV